MNKIISTPYDNIPKEAFRSVLNFYQAMAMWHYIRRNEEKMMYYLYEYHKAECAYRRKQNGN